MRDNPWLTNRQKRIFEAFYRDGLRIEDIAAEMDVNRRTIERELCAIRQLLLSDK